MQGDRAASSTQSPTSPPPVAFDARTPDSHRRTGVRLSDITQITRVRIALTTELAAAYVSRNAIPAADLPGLIATLGAAIEGLTQGGTAAPDVEAPEANSIAPRPADIRRSITPDVLISFVDGQPYKTLKRHLTANGLTPDIYRATIGLPADYPMVAPSYSERRSAIAYGLGLGTTSGRRKSA